MFASIAAAALIGAVGGGLGGLLGALLDKLFSRGKPSKRNFGAVMGAVVGMTTANQSDLRERVARVVDPPSATESFGQDILSIPGVQAQIRGKSPQEVRPSRSACRQPAC